MSARIGIWTVSIPILQKICQNQDAALNVIDELEKAIFSLEQFPERGSIRRASAGDYAMFTGIRASLSRDSLSTGGAVKPHKMLRSSESSGTCCTPVRARNSA